MSTSTLNIKGLHGPVPLIVLGSTMRSIKVGNKLTIIADDPAFEDQVKDYCEMKDYELKKLQKKGNEIIAEILKK